ncbi:MAG: PqqD family protein [Candidatus Competibacteraceae bacterium]
MTELTFNKLSLSSKVLFQEIDGEAVLLDFAGERYYRLDTVATRIWQLLEQHSELEAIVQMLCAEFDVDEAVLRQDVDNFINSLAGAGLILLL